MSLVSIEGTKISDSTYAKRVRSVRMRPKTTETDWVNAVKGSWLKKAILKFILNNF